MRVSRGFCVFRGCPQQHKAAGERGRSDNIKNFLCGHRRGGGEGHNWCGLRYMLELLSE